MSDNKKITNSNPKAAMDGAPNQPLRVKTNESAPKAPLKVKPSNTTNKPKK